MKYEEPEMEVILLEGGDVLTLSDGGDGSGGKIDYSNLDSDRF